MSLKRAIELLPCDRETERALRAIVIFFKGHTGEWYETTRVAELSGVSGEQAASVLGVLCRTFVLDCCDVPPRYRFEGDRVIEYEFDGFLRRAELHSGAHQSNVNRFRERYGR